MTKNIKRMLMAFVISAGCFYGVEYWYRTLDLGLKITSRQESVARLVRHNNEVQRKPVTRLIWEAISNNENLFPGEAIRTTATSDATIMFLKTGTTVELEPNSQVIIQGNSNDISLNFVKGNMFVKQDDSQGDAGSIKLKTAKGEIDLKKANLSLSQTDKGVDLEVYSGKANLTKNGKTIEVDANDTKNTFFKLLSPLPHLPAFITPNRKDLVKFQWEKLPPGYKVYIERGLKRTQLSRTEGKFSTGERGELALFNKTGKLYWRAVAVPDDPKKETKYSKTIYTQVIAKAPPVLLSPEKDKTLVLIDEKKVTYKWTTTSKSTEGLILEVARDPALKRKVLQKNLGEKLSSLTSTIKDPGTYYWRITGFMKIKKKLEPVSSPVQKFTISFNAPLIPPQLKSPSSAQTITFQQASQTGVFFTWEAVNGINQYRIHLERSLVADTKSGVEPQKRKYIKDVTNPLYTWSDLPSGNYDYYVTSVSDKNEESKPSEKRSFTIGNIPKINWTSGPKRTKYQYVTATPSIAISWKNIKKAGSFRIRYAKKDDFVETSEWSPIITNQFKGPLETPGDWNFQVEALDAKGQTIARSDIKTVLIVERPLLRGPAFAPQVPTPIASSRRGTLSVAWNKVPNAQGYYVQLTDDAGNVVRNLSASSNRVTMKGLSPGKYRISVQSVDQYERPGPNGELRDVIVPDGSNIAAPKLKRIDVK